MKRLTVILLLLVSFPVIASHIVGGEIELLRISGFTYRLNLIYYFDVTNNPGRNIQAEEPRITMYIYRKSDNVRMDSIILPFLSKTQVAYTNPDCSSDGIRTDKIIYTKDIQLSASIYNAPEGYYIVWARCCRNYSILNIISEDPDTGGEGAGQTFYLEFPPVTTINSSPKNFPALSDYACPTKPYYVDFAGTDDDGDSLAYSLVTPLSTWSVTPIPEPVSAPYPDVKWRPGFGLDNIVNHAPANPKYPDMRISREGFLRVTPKDLGLYVFAVKVEEYRDKKKIGEVRRDFQLLVVDCNPAVPPVIAGKAQSAPVFTKGQIDLQFDNTVTNEDRFAYIIITDSDAVRATNNFKENITLKVIPLNFKGSVGNINIDPNSGTLNKFDETHSDTLVSKVFFPACPFFLGGPYQIGIIAYDDACALPLSDTIKVTVDVQPPANERAKFNPPDNVSATLNEGDSQAWPFEAHDADNDQLVLLPLTEGFSMSKSGMKTEITDQVPGLLKGSLTWDAFCDIYDFTKRTNFVLKLLVDDVDQCDLNDPDTLTYRLNVILPPDNKPVVDTDLTSNPFEVVVDGFEKRIYDKWTFHVTGSDLADNDKVTVRMVGDGFDPTAYGMSMPKASGVGSVVSTFDWDLLCDKFNLAERDTFNIAFLAIDSVGKCRVRQVDSLVVKVKVLPPKNIAPQLSILNLNDGITFDGENAVVWPGQQLDLQLNVSDGDNAPVDNLTLRMINLGGDQVPEGWQWEDVTGPSVLTGLFSWAPLCSVFNDNIFDHDFYFDFSYEDGRCLTGVVDTVRVNVKVKDRESGSFDMEPVNVFTPNNDGVNDFYSMERRDPSGELVNILPPDNCQGVFENVSIYNRWGRPVFTSKDRNFRWYGTDQAAGVYFYHVTFTNRDYKGTVSLRD